MFHASARMFHEKKPLQAKQADRGERQLRAADIYRSMRPAKSSARALAALAEILDVSLDELVLGRSNDRADDVRDARFRSPRKVDRPAANAAYYVAAFIKRNPE
jgi:hypothetical protein